MVAPLAGRVVAALVGGLLVVVALSSVTETLIVSRSVKSRLTQWVDRMVDWAYERAAVRVGDFRRRDQLRATQAATRNVRFMPLRRGSHHHGCAPAAPFSWPPTQVNACLLS